MNGMGIFSPSPYVVLDLETGDAPAEAVDAAIGSWKPPSNWRSETIEKKRAEQAEKLNGKAALLDASPIICAALKTERLSIVLNGMDETSYDIHGWLCFPATNERGLLSLIRVVLDSVAVETSVLVGHNIFGFDLPKLRNAFIRHRMKVPLALADFDQPAFDTMKQIRYFSMENADERYVSLDTVARVLGIPQPKQIITGADCPRLYKNGEYAEILTYCAVDVATTERAYLLMTGQAPELVEGG